MTARSLQTAKPPVHQRDASCSPANARTVLLYVLIREGSGHGY